MDGGVAVDGQDYACRRPPRRQPDRPDRRHARRGRGPIRSGWLYGPGEEEIDETFGDENVTLVFPFDANGTWYVDWAEDDPVLGRQQWETFIMAELLPLVEAQPDIYLNGKRAIGGLSMGTTAAVHLAATYPELFDATFGISWCYSTVDPIGYQITSTVVESRGGTVTTPWHIQRA